MKTECSPNGKGKRIFTVRVFTNVLLAKKKKVIVGSSNGSLDLYFVKFVFCWFFFKQTA